MPRELDAAECGSEFATPQLGRHPLLGPMPVPLASLDNGAGFHPVGVQ